MKASILDGKSSAAKRDIIGAFETRSASRDQPGVALLYNEFAMEVRRQQALGLALIALLIMLLVLLRRLWSGA